MSVVESRVTGHIMVPRDMLHGSGSGLSCLCNKARLDSLTFKASNPLRRLAFQVSAAPAGSFVSDVTNSFEVEFVGVAKLLVLAIAEKTALSRIFRLRTRGVLLVPPELRAPAKLGAPS